MPPEARPKISAGGRAGLMGSRRTPKRRHRAILAASGTFCQKIHAHERCSRYQPSNEAETLSDTSKFKAYMAIPYAHALGGVLRRMKLNVSGTKKPDATPLANCSPSSV